MNQKRYGRQSSLKSSRNLIKYKEADQTDRWAPEETWDNDDKPENIPIIRASRTSSKDGAEDNEVDLMDVLDQHRMNKSKMTNDEIEMEQINANVEEDEDASPQNKEKLEGSEDSDDRDDSPKSESSDEEEDEEGDGDEVIGHSFGFDVN